MELMMPMIWRTIGMVNLKWFLPPDCLSLASKDRDFLLSPTGTQVKISDLESKIVGIYFSANWYPPSRKFTPVLANAYEQLKNYDPGFEIVFVSSDEDHDAFDDYRALMPWLAIPFSDLESK
ncbi:hypothetical protein Pfo_030865 [Paulownia fortunei]|nr:hypothetical protein Pfo_030865 [Paulownia fortunei]